MKDTKTKTSGEINNIHGRCNTPDTGQMQRRRGEKEQETEKTEKHWNIFLWTNLTESFIEDEDEQDGRWTFWEEKSLFNI